MVYWLNILLLGAVLFGSLRYALRAGLMKEEATTEVRSANQRRSLSGKHSLRSVRCPASSIHMRAMCSSSSCNSTMLLRHGFVRYIVFDRYGQFNYVSNSI